MDYRKMTIHTDEDLEHAWVELDDPIKDVLGKEFTNAVKEFIEKEFGIEVKSIKGQNRQMFYSDESLDCEYLYPIEMIKIKWYWECKLSLEIK